MRLQQLLKRLATLGPAMPAEARLADLLTRSSIGLHRFNERVVADYFDDLADQVFGVRAPLELRLTMLTIGFCLRSARAPVLTASLSGEQVLEALFERAGASKKQNGRVMRAMGEARKGSQELPLTAVVEHAPDADTCIIDLGTPSPSANAALAGGLKSILRSPQCVALVFSDAASSAALHPANAILQTSAGSGLAVTHHALGPLPSFRDGRTPLQIELLHG